MSGDSREDLQDQILAYLDQRLDGDEVEALQVRLENDPEARKEFIKFAHLDTELRDAIPLEPTVSGGDSKTLRSDRKLWLVFVGPLAVLVVTALFFFKLGREPESDDPFPVARYDSGVAVISAQADALWDTSPNKLNKGGALPRGRFQLRSGLVQIDFYGGATISLSGPAEFELVSRDEVILHRGHLKADVPPAARGFKIWSGDVLVEDLGTSFGLAVQDDSSADIVVFDGEVRAFDKKGESVSLLAGESANLSKGRITPQSTDETVQFPDIRSVFAGEEDHDLIRYTSWKETSVDLRRDPRLIAYYDFENLTSVSRRLRNRAIAGLGRELDGGIVGARVAEGRWPGKTALDFRQEGDRVRFQIPGDFEALTIFAWVRIDALDRGLNSLFLTDYFDPREFHWQLSRKGALHFAISPKGVENLKVNNRRFYSSEFWDPGKSGQWFFLATTVDRSLGVKHFIDGLKVGFSGGTNREKPLPVMRIGKADLGNWSDPIWANSMRTLNGRIDEFALFKEALPDEQITQLYENGRQ